MSSTQRPNVHPTAEVADDAILPTSARVWHQAQVRNSAVLGENCIVGKGAYVGTGVVMGDNCKLQNYALVYEPARLGAGVFVGPAAVFTNDHFPRAANPDLSIKSASDWEAVGVTCLDGASIGARAVCVAPVTIGRWAMVGAGSTVIRDVPDFALVVGTPARQIGWVGKSGSPLEQLTDTEFRCPIDGSRYHLIAPDRLVESDTQ